MINRPHMSDSGRAPYEKPQVKRVILALEETLSVNCKIGPEDCGPEAENPGTPGS